MAIVRDRFGIRRSGVINPAEWQSHDEPTTEQIVKRANELFSQIQKGLVMHYRNGREAKNGDKVVQIGGCGDGAQIVAVGILYDAKPGNDYCNGAIAPIQGAVSGACLCDCLHVDDIAELLRGAGLDKRPAGK